MKTIFSFRFEVGSFREVLVAYVSVGTDPKLCFAEIAKTAESGGFPDSLVIMGADHIIAPLKAAADTPGDLGARHLSRLHAGITINFYGFGRDGVARDLGTMAGRTAAPLIRSREIFTAGVTALVKEHGVEVSSTSAYHFQSPSGKHGQSFLRLSNMLVREREISFVAASLLEFLPTRVDQAFIDTPSLFAVTAAVERLLVAFGEGSVRSDNFGSYKGKFEIDTDDASSSIVLISASTSGNLGREILKKNLDKGLSAEQVIHVLHLGAEPSEYPTACDLSLARNPRGLAVPAGNNSKGDCRLCDAGSIAVPLIGDHFEFGATENAAVELTRKASVAKATSFIASDLVKHAALKVGTNRGARSVFDVDVKALLRSGPFSDKVEYVGARAIPRRLKAIVHLNDEGSKALCESLLDRFKITGVDVLSEEKFTKQGLDPSGVVGSVLVVAGAIGSGRSLRALGLTLRMTAPDDPIVFFVGLSKAAAGVRESMIKTLRYTPKATLHDVNIVQSLSLPDRSFPNAWDDELELLRAPGFREAAASSSAPFDERRTYLEDATSKATALFWPAADGSDLAFTKGFAFWDSVEYELDDASQADVFYTVSCALEELRSSKDGLSSSPLRHAVLADENFTRFSDPLLQACFLRAARPAELNYADNAAQSLRVGRILASITARPLTARGGPTMEVLVALATHRLQLKQEHANEVLKALEATPGSPSHIAAMAAYTRSTLKL